MGSSYTLWSLLTRHTLLVGEVFDSYGPNYVLLSQPKLGFELVLLLINRYCQKHERH